ncbi:MAG: serine/threonine protein kinase [Oligoflexia bacterium]|nr:serine/threonine protein kinase [Oligoflexia bacterium]
MANDQIAKDKNRDQPHKAKVAESASYLSRFGRYLILDHLVDGGMAKICRARILDEQTNKIVAIKMIRPQYSQDQAFKKMFMDEIKVAFGLIHPNIVQTYDYGILHDQLYTAIEYIDGKNLKQFLEKLKEKGFIFPVEISSYIISQVCQALSYAHTFTDKLTGRLYNIIHRDISPHNVMLSYDGSVKVIDFGIAKANTNSEETQAGTIKGKISYLAPEYLEGVELDHRYDQFSVGITLWEMLCGKKLFHAENELAILKKIQACKIPRPSSINKNVSSTLDDIVMKSVSKQREERYENMELLNRALVKFLYSQYPDFNAADLKSFARELFQDDIKKDRDKLQEYGKIDIHPFIKDLKNELSGKSQTHAHSTTAQGESSEKAAVKEAERTAHRVILDFEDMTDDRSKLGLDLPGALTSNKGHLAKITPRTSPTPAGPKVNIDHKVDHKKEEKLSPLQPTSTAANNSKKVTPIKNSKGVPPATDNDLPPDFVEINDVILEQQERRQKIIKFAMTVGITISVAIGGLLYFGKIKKQGNTIAQSETSPAATGRKLSSVAPPSEQTKSPSDVKTKKISFKNTNPYQRFYINDKEVTNTIYGMDLQLYSELKIRIEQEGKKTIFLTLQLTEDDSGIVNLPDPENGTFGILDILGDYPDGSTISFHVEGNEVSYPIPVSGKKLPVGSYQGVIYNAFSKIKSNTTFEIKEDLVTKVRNGSQSKYSE